LSAKPLFPDVVDQATQWFENLGTGVATRCVAKEVGQKCRVWRLSGPLPQLEGSHAEVVLLHDFPLSPARLEVDKRFCLRLPHVELDGHLCHGVVPDAADFEDPVAGIQRVLQRLEEFLRLCESPGWIEAEFNRERSDYWSRYSGTVSAPTAYRTKELLLDVEVGADVLIEAPAICLADGDRALATSSGIEPERVAKARGWPVGTITRGAAVVVPLPLEERWTPNTWPRTFAELNQLVSQLSGNPDWLMGWHARRWPNKAPLFVILSQGAAAFGWRIMPAHFGRVGQSVVLPVQVSRVDRRWSLCRDHDADKLATLSEKRVVVFGAGSLGSPVVELLARAGVGQIEVVDPQTFDAENTARHVLGALHVGKGKAAAVCSRLQQYVPGAKLTPFGDSASVWLSNAASGPPVDLVVDCSGEAVVRIAAGRLRATRLRGAPVLMAWMEPGCAAGHVVVTAGDDAWPTTDPVETTVNFAQWPAGLRIELPGCGQGFHPYGMADTSRVAGLVAERALAILKGADTGSAVWSMVRNKKYFLEISSAAQFNHEPPTAPDVESKTVRRSLKEVLANEP